MLPIPEISDAEAAFPANPPLPKWDEIPEDFRKGWAGSSHPWCRIPSKWFFKGGTLDEFGLTPKDGVNADAAMRAIMACLRSFAPKHEHKIAGVGFMLSEWFDLNEPPAKET